MRAPLIEDIPHRVVRRPCAVLYANFVIELLNESKRDLVLRVAVSCDSVLFEDFPPIKAKNLSMLFSERSSPTNQIARRVSRSLTTMRYVCRFFI